MNFIFLRGIVTDGQHLFSHGGFGQALGIGINKSNRDEQTERDPEIKLGSNNIKALK